MRSKTLQSCNAGAAPRTPSSASSNAYHRFAILLHRVHSDPPSHAHIAAHTRHQLGLPIIRRQLPSSLARLDLVKLFPVEVSHLCALDAVRHTLAVSKSPRLCHRHPNSLPTDARYCPASRSLRRASLDDGKDQLQAS